MSDFIEDKKRRKRIDRYKKIIIGIILTMIILPTVLCIILFAVLGSMRKEIRELRNWKETVQLNSEMQMAVFEEESVYDVVENGKNEITNETDTANDTAETAQEKESESVVHSSPVSEKFDEQKEVEKALLEGRKVVYLTFDDGPGDNTNALLDVLKQYGVKASFFVNYHDNCENLYRRIVNEGHTLAMHTYAHDYQTVYKDVDSFANQVTSLSDYLYQVTGKTMDLFRFPGGSSNRQTRVPIQTYIEYLNEHDITYFDWNVSSGDGADGLTSQDVYNNVIKGIDACDISVVLMHDSVTRDSTLEAVPLIIEKLQSMGALILPITDATTPVHHNIQ